jgi:hypothetical protein
VGAERTACARRALVVEPCSVSFVGELGTALTQPRVASSVVASIRAAGSPVFRPQRTYHLDFADSPGLQYRRASRRSLTVSAVQQAVAAAERHAPPLQDSLVTRRRGLRPRLLAAMVRLNATSAFAAERQVVSRSAARFVGT